MPLTVSKAPAQKKSQPSRPLLLPLPINQSPSPRPDRPSQLSRWRYLTQTGVKNCALKHFMLFKSSKNIDVRLIHALAPMTTRGVGRRREGGLCRNQENQQGKRNANGVGEIRKEVGLGFIEWLNGKVRILQRHCAGGIISRSQPLSSLLQTAQ